MSIRVLVPLTTGFEEIETIAPVDLLRRAGIEVTMAALTEERLVTGRCGVTVRADAVLAAVAEDDWDLVFIPGGPGVKALRADGRSAALARRQVGAGRPVAAICAAPTVLADAGVLAGRRFTAHFSVHAELPGALAQEAVVEDGLILTSRGAGTAVAFGLALVRRLCGEAKAAEVAIAIML